MAKIKGFVLTVSIFLLASILLYLVGVLSSYSNAMQMADGRLAVLETVNAESDAAAFGMRSLFFLNAVNITQNGTNVTFSQSLPIPSSYSSNVSAFALFIDGYGFHNTSIRTSEASIPTLYIDPNDMVVNYSSTRMEIRAQNSSASSQRIQAYFFSIVLNASKPTVSWSPLNTLLASNPNAMLVVINVTGTNGQTDTSQYLDKYAISTLNLSNGTNYQITLNFSSPASVDITYPLPMALNATFQFSNPVSVELGRNIINTTQGSEVKKITSVYVLEN